MTLPLLAIAAVFLPIFPLSIVYNRASALVPIPVVRALLVLVWPQIGIVLIFQGDGSVPGWVAPLAVVSALLYAFRAITVREVHGWIGFLATSQWSILWLAAAAGTDRATMQVFALAFSAPLVLLTFLAAGLERRFGAAYTYLYGGLGSTLPRFAGLLTITVLAAMGAPLFPGFFVLVRVLLETTSVPLLLGALLIALVWSWAGIRVLRGLVVGADNHAERVSDWGLGLTVGYAVLLAALLVQGVYLSGGLT